MLRMLLRLSGRPRALIEGLQPSKLRHRRLQREAVSLLREEWPHLQAEALSDPFAIKCNTHRVLSFRSIALALGGLSPLQRKTILRNFFSSLLIEPKQDSATLQQLKWRIRCQILPVRPFPPGAFPAIIALSDTSCIVFVIDHATALEYINSESVQRWRVGADEMLQIARENLEQVSRNVPIQVKQIGSHKVATIDDVDDYVAARIVLPEFMARVRHAVGCEVVVVGIPNRRTMVAWPLDFPGAEDLSEALARDRQPNPCTSELFLCSAEGLHPLGGASVRVLPGDAT